MALYNTGSNEKGFESGIELALQSILAGPEFLFRVAQDPAGVTAGTVYPISDIELASRLSFFLWSTIPDKDLLDLAEQGKLREPGILEGQIRRMMADTRSGALIDNFGEQWLVMWISLRLTRISSLSLIMNYVRHSNRKPDCGLKV